MDPGDLVDFRKFSHLHEAEMAIATLEASGVDAVLRDSSFGGFRPETSIAGGGVTVLVRRDQVDTAREILDAPALHEVPADTITCANCGRSLQGTVCPACDAGEDREALLNPAVMRSGISKLKAGLFLGFLVLMIAPVIFKRLTEMESGAWRTAFYIAGGVVLVIVVAKFFISGSEERL